MKKFIDYWLPPILWMVLIFSLSNRQRIAFSDTQAINFLIFKLFHIIEYFILFMLNFRAISSVKSKIWIKQTLIITLCFTLFFAISDELHQTFVPTREGTIRDVVIDSIGITIAFMYTKYNRVKLTKFFHETRY